MKQNINNIAIFRDGQLDRKHALKSFSRAFSRVFGRFMYKVLSAIINAVDQLVIEANKNNGRR